MRINVLENLPKIFIYLAVFLTPIFFLPFTLNVLEFPKQTIFVFLVFLAFIFWLLKVLMQGKISFNSNLLTFFIFLYFLALLFSTLFSLWRYGSFWGLPLNISSSFLSSFSFLIFLFLILNLFEKEEGYWIFLCLIISLFLAAIFGILQIFGKFLFPLDFSKNLNFNTVGTPNFLVILMSSILPLVFAFLFFSRGIFKFFFAFLCLIFLIVIFIFNFWVGWTLLLIGAVTVLAFGTTKRELFPPIWFLTTIFLLAFSLVFIIFRPNLNLFNLVPEFNLPLKINLEIISKSLTERGAFSFLFGSGPSTFIFDYSKSRPSKVNELFFWNLKFEKGTSEFFNIIAEKGVLGAITFLIILIFVFLAGLNYLLKNSFSEKKSWFFALGLFSSWLTSSFSLFFYPANFTILFLFWLLTAGFLTFIYQNKRIFQFLSLPRLNLFFSFFSVFVLVLSFYLLFLTGQRYWAEIQYQKGLIAFRAGENEKAINHLKKAIFLTNEKSDHYWRDIAQLYVFRVEEELKKENSDIESLSKTLSPLVQSAIFASKKAVEISPRNVLNHSVKGFIYQSFYGLIGGVEDFAIQSYEECLRLEPTNPYFFVEIGRLLLVKKEIEKAREQFEKAISLKSDYAPARFQMAMTFVSENKIEEAIARLENLKQEFPFDAGLAFQIGILYYNKGENEKAKKEFERAVAVSSDYSNARYYLGLIYDKEGKKDLAIKEFEKIEELNPANKEVKKILSNLREGKSALEGLTIGELPIEEKPSEKLGP